MILRYLDFVGICICSWVVLLLVLGCITRLILVSYYTVAILDPKSIGPFEIKEGKEKLKRYGALVKCLASRAIDIETTKSMDTDLFILALRRFIARRGNIRSIRCDNEINFIGTEKKLEKSMNEMDNKRIENSKEKI